ncbi:MAG: peptidase T [Candidatus Glassbacteria bacterium]
MDVSTYRQEMIDRFFKYVGYDTQSSETSDTYPSTDKQKVLGEVLVDDLKSMGLKDAKMDKHGYVMATLPANTSRDTVTLGFIAHMDTSPDVSGKDVKPELHENYKGGDIQLSGDPSQVIRESENPALRDQIGKTIITSDGRTLLGADNKAGIAEILTAMRYLIDHPEIKHGKIRVAITPDEEVGEGTKHFDIKAFGADFAYTIDGETAGEVENETFCADSVTLTFNGVNVHPGYAKNKLVSSIKIAADFIERLPKDRMSPETTEKREGYVHPNTISGGVEKSIIKLLIRDFTVEGLKEKEDYLKKLAEEVVSKYPRASMDFKVEESYRNMRYKLDEEPRVTEYALKAVERSGLKPVLNIIRGGTDGARLSYQGLLTPNIFTGGHNFHSRHEWISVEDMLKAVEVIVNLVEIWEQA